MVRPTTSGAAPVVGDNGCSFASGVSPVAASKGLKGKVSTFGGKVRRPALRLFFPVAGRPKPLHIFPFKVRNGPSSSSKEGSGMSSVSVPRSPTPSLAGGAQQGSSHRFGMYNGTGGRGASSPISGCSMSGVCCDGNGSPLTCLTRRWRKIFMPWSVTINIAPTSTATAPHRETCPSSVRTTMTSLLKTAKVTFRRMVRKTSRAI
mmetsp:Transcript_32797/g.59973  ORF Transcript_32797/g.59973 Transcript_32797/m.59973 type:complete len:205 (+) Transcript_32797:101-715(+)